MRHERERGREGGREEHTISSKIEIFIPLNTSNSGFPSTIVMMPIKIQAKQVKLIIASAKNQGIKL